MDGPARIAGSFQEQARLLDLIFKHTLDSVVLMDKDFNFIRVSESYARSCQRDSSEFPGRNHFEMYPSPLKEEITPFVKEKKIYKRNSRPFVFPDHPDWGTTYWDLELVPILGIDEEVEFLLFTLKDVTEQKRAELALQESESRLAAIIDNSTAVIYVKDVTGKYLLINRWHELLFHFSKQDIIGKTDHDLFPAETAGHFRANDLKVIEKRRPMEFDETVLQDDGFHDYISIKFPLFDATGGLYAVCSISTDITSRKKEEENLLKVEKLESLGLLAGGIAHDFNNILTAVLGNISLAKSWVVPEERVFSRLTEAEKASLRASELAQQLLTFARGGEPIKRTTSIQSLLIKSTRFLLTGSNVGCAFSFKEGLWPVEIDESQINQVVQNLVINAQQAMPKGGTLKVEARNITFGGTEEGISLRKGDYVRISFQDEGTGIPPELLQKIFDPYFTTKEKGSGLGLSISYSIIKRHQGLITVESRSGSGTTFFIFLPASSETVAPQENGEKEEMTPGRGKVLIMDDEKSILDFAGETLRRLGYEVAFSEGGREAVQLFKKAKNLDQPFDVVITDLTVPGDLGGVEILLRIKEIDPHAKVIVSSGYSNDPTLSNFKSFGFSDCLIKPYRAFELSAVLKRVLKENRLET